MTAPAAVEPPFERDEEVLALVRAFEACTLTRAQWTHRAHLTVALWYASRHEPAEALDLVRQGIRRLNTAVGVVSTPTSGYHETITRLYLRVVSRFVADEAPAGWSALANRLFEKCGGKDLPLRYYSESRLMSPAARAAWVEPDLAPLP